MRESNKSPIFVVAPPRSGGVLLASALARSPQLSAVPGDADVGEAPPHADGERALYSAPRFALRVAELAERFPEASFVYVYRDPEAAISALLGAWESGDGVTHPDLEGWTGPPWTGPLIPGWKQLKGKDMTEIAARQWAAISEAALNDLEKLDPGRWAVTDHNALLADPKTHVDRICEFLGIEPSEEITAPLRMVREELQAADRRVRQGPTPAVEHVREDATKITAKVRELFAEGPEGHLQAMPSADSPLRSVYSGGMRELVGRLDGSILVSTYQTGKLICLREQGGTVNTHFRNFDKPMGLAAHEGRFALGGRTEVWDFRDVPSAAPRVEPVGTHDACYVPRNRHVTGDIAIHEIAFAQGELWLCATAFSCLGTLNAEHSFVPRWRPGFISELAPGDRCHLNGMCVVEDEVRYVTALGQTDEQGGWREGKARGGVILEVPSSDVIVDGLSMPHSPRWHDGKLWFLESGEGGLCVADLEAGEWETVAELPGFTRGLAFVDRIALVGLSQVRETGTFGGLPLTERLDQSERLCGVWAVDTTTGRELGFLRFEELVQEVFDVAILPGKNFPEIAEPGSTATSQTFALP
ncbi:MAG: hypothetical protein QOD60_2453 [Solirubrobacterales bacterium]|nr:hypothetical protein [Solirubrobacterales bacterium]